MRAVAVTLALALAAAAVRAQEAPPTSTGRITRLGVARAQAVVDSVYLDRLARLGTIEGGDWASYLMARLGVEPLPDSTGILVAVDTTLIVLSGRMQDLPAEARAMLGPLATLLDSTTVVRAEISLDATGRGVVRFRLERVLLGGFAFPELVLHSMMLRVGEQYPALTRSGRDLYVQIPPDGTIALLPGAVRIGVSAAAGSSPPPRGQGRKDAKT